jgi:phenylacetate-CoA ligase
MSVYIAVREYYMSVYMTLSTLDDVVWPAIVGGRQATYLSLQFQMEQSQWWSEDELVSAQLEQLSLLLQHAVTTVPYYKKRYGEIPFDFSGRLTLNEWRRLPILTRDDLQKAGNSLNSKAVPKEHGKLNAQHSSGSTGKPVSIKQTESIGSINPVLVGIRVYWVLGLS